MKKCIGCKKNKRNSSFYIDKRSNTLYSYCKKCNNSISKKWYDEQKKINPSKFYKFKRNERLLKRYGISYSGYNILVKKQNHKCLICDKKNKLVVDHCHKTKVIRGLLCSTCNIGLGGFKDSIDNLKRAITYLKGAISDLRTTSD